MWIDYMHEDGNEILPEMVEDDAGFETEAFSLG